LPKEVFVNLPEHVLGFVPVSVKADLRSKFDQLPQLSRLKLRARVAFIKTFASV